MNKISEETNTIDKDVETLVNEAGVLIENTISKIQVELINMYWELGKLISEYKERKKSKYCDAVITKFSKELSTIYGKGFSVTNISYAAKFYMLFSEFPPAEIYPNISWSHYREVISLNDIKKAIYYLKEANGKNLTRVEFREYIKTQAYERIISNQRGGVVKHLAEKGIKDPLILNIEKKKRTEKELEDEIVKNISNFKREFGNKIMFFESQYKIIHNGLRYKVDLVMYDKENRCYILIDLKINKVSRKDISQIKFYVEYFNNHIKEYRDINTIGIILCETKDVRVENDEDIYQIKYLNEIPKEEELLKIINENKIILLKTEELKIEGVK